MAAALLGKDDNHVFDYNARISAAELGTTSVVPGPRGANVGSVAGRRAFSVPASLRSGSNEKYRGAGRDHLQLRQLNSWD